jgi:hypothetical protein
MPGFNINGVGGLTNAPAHNTEVRRRHRWQFETLGRGTGVWSQTELLMLLSASRPNVKFEEPEMHHNQEVVRFAGKQDWDPVSLVWYDGEQNPDISKGLYHWLETVTNMESIQVAHPRNYKRQASLAMLDGAGRPNERWDMYGTWPASINWQELDYSSTDLLTCEATLRYDRAKRQCLSPLAPSPISPSCP